MTPDAVLAHAPRLLSRAQRKSYFEQGYLLIENFVDAAWLERLRAVTADFVERSRDWTESDDLFDLAPGHGRDHPFIRRIKTPEDQSEIYWKFSNGPIADLAVDLLGPDIAFHHSKLNFKWHEGGDEVAWHQDFPFYPHTNDAVLAIGVYLRDVGEEDGPLAVLPGSHRGPVHDHYGADGTWTGHLDAEAVAGLDLSAVRHLTGPAGSVTVHAARLVHGSPPSRKADGRPLLINAYRAADAMPYTPYPLPGSHAGEIVRGRAARQAHLQPLPCRIPPDWSGGYTSIFAAQAGEGAKAAE